MLLGDLRAMALGDRVVQPWCQRSSAMLWLEKNNVTLGGHLHPSLQCLGTAREECARANAGNCREL